MSLVRSFFAVLLCALLSPAIAAPGDAAQRLNQLLEAYYDEFLELNPIDATLIGDNRFNDRFSVGISEEDLARGKALDTKYLKALEEIDAGALTGQDQLNYEFFKRNREIALEGYRYPNQLIPVSQFFSTPSFFASMGSGHSIQPFANAKDYDNWLARAAGFADWVDAAIDNMRLGMELGVVQPRFAIEKLLPQLEAHMVKDVNQSIFATPLKNFPDGIPAAKRQRLTAAYHKLIAEVLVPAYERLHAFLKEAYLPRCRDTAGLMHLPGGADWYAYNVRSVTTTDLSPDQIHEIGLKEVERITAEMETVKREIGFDGSLTDFFDYLRTAPENYFDKEADLLAAYQDIKRRVDARLPDLFGILPKADYEVKPIEAYRAKSAAAAFYVPPTADGSRAGVFYVNTFNLKARPKFTMEALSLHESNPGHHFQIARQYEIESLPRFRRFGGVTAYIEGWGLYAESLGQELGMYTDPYQHFGKLTFEIWRAIRLVVDTGIHAKGWTREQAIKYMLAHTALTETDAVAEVERYIVIPGQALAYKLGQLKITELRARAEQRLGKRFDVRAFHDAILQDGPLPLDILDRKMNAWIEAQRDA
ncbi:MAG: DUF885 domain-containing protein [Gammaproteobacteria bacterium]|nr:DUF885 domain-containing protein [Gammaproteobacteria bacterium]